MDKRNTKTVGNIIRSTREKSEMTREQLAKKLKITPVYLGHIERDDPVRISPRIVIALKKNLGRKISEIDGLVPGHNYFVNLWRRHNAKKN